MSTTSIYEPAWACGKPQGNMVSLMWTAALKMLRIFISGRQKLFVFLTRLEETQTGREEKISKHFVLGIGKERMMIDEWWQTRWNISVYWLVCNKCKWRLKGLIYDILHINILYEYILEFVFLFHAGSCSVPLAFPRWRAEQWNSTQSCLYFSWMCQ